MDHKKHYDNLMSTRLLLKKDRYKLKKNGYYFEGHHILPKCKGGTGTSSKGLKCDNIVLLTAREHFIAHWLLWMIYRDRQMALAFHKMVSVNKDQKRVFSSSGYEEARLAFSYTNKGNKYGAGVKKTLSLEQRERISLFMKGRWSGDKNPFYGKRHTIDSKILISNKLKNRPVESTPGYKGIRVVIKDGLTIAEFKTSKEVANFIGCSASNVRHVLGGKQKSANGYKIKYKSEILESGTHGLTDRISKFKLFNGELA